MILETRDVRFAHDRNHPPICYPDLAFDAPFLASVIGSNGVGKTTLARMLSGFLLPTGGEIRVLGRAPHSREARGSVALVPDSPILFYDLSVREQVAYVADLDDVPKRTVDDIIERLGLDAYADHPPGALSRGWRQRTALAMGLLRPSPVLVIDEPFAGLDTDARASLAELLANRHRSGASTVVITHNPDELVAVATDVIELKAAS